MQPGETVTYQEKTGDKIVSFTWNEHRDGEKRIITLIGDGLKYTNVCLPTGETLEWYHENSEGLKIEARRKQNKIYMSGTSQGVPFQRVEIIDERPWFQPLSYSLRTFLESDAETTSFWIVRDSNQKTYAMKARKTGREEIETLSGLVPTHKVEVRVDGFFSAFWHGTYWYRQDDGMFLKYKSVQGVGAPPTVITASCPQSSP